MSKKARTETPLRATVLVTQRLVRASWTRRTWLTVGATAALLVVTWTIMTAWSLSAAQVAQRDLGQYELRLTSTAMIRPGPNVALSRVETLTRSPDVSAASVLVSFDVKPVGREAEFTEYRESDWHQRPFTGITLTDGRWPARPGEVALAGPISTRVGSELEVLAGRSSFHVVGRVDDSYSAYPLLLGGPGTWTSLPASIAYAREGLGANLSILTNRRDEPRARTALTRNGFSSLAPIEDRATVGPQRSWLTRTPFAYTIPSLLLPVLAAGVVVASGRRRCQHFIASVTDVGMARVAVRGAVVSAFGLSALTGAAVGIAVGASGGVLARKIVKPHLAQAIGPLDGLPLAMGRIVLGGLLGTFVAAIVVTQRQDNARDPVQMAATRDGSVADVGQLRTVRRAGAVAAICFAILLSPRVGSATSAMTVGALLLVAWLLVLPDVIRSASTFLPTQRPGPRLAARLLANGSTASVAGAGLISVLVALPLTTSLLLTATNSTSRVNALAEVGPGQLGVWARGGDANPADPTIQQFVAKSLHSKARNVIHLYYTDGWYEANAGNALVLALSTPEEIAELFGQTLSDKQTNALTAGGMLAWNDGTLLVNNRPVLSSMQTVFFRPNQEWQAHAGAVLLKSTAQRLGMHLTIGGTVYTGVDREASDRAVSVLSAGGLDVRAIHVYHSPEPLVPPRPLVASVVSLAVLLFGASLTANHAQASAMRRQMGRLIAIGATPRFARRTYVICQVFTSAFAICGAAFVAAATTIILLVTVDSVQITPPWSIIGGSLFAFVMASLASTFAATRSLQSVVTRNS